MESLFSISDEILPAVKWIGGKRELVPTLRSMMPESYGRYFEPFVGGGALFFNIAKKGSYISDINQELIIMYEAIRDNPEALMEDLSHHEFSSEYYYSLRNIDRLHGFDSLPWLKRASRYIYLNKLSFNGLMRVNRKGQMNAAYNGMTNVSLYDRDNIFAMSELLKGTEIRCADFTYMLEEANQGDFAYLDPPYVPVSKTASYTRYTKDGFDEGMNMRLRDFCDELDRKGVMFMMSNSSAPQVYELFGSYRIDEVMAKRKVNCDRNGRGAVTETVIRNY